MNTEIETATSVLDLASTAALAIPGAGPIVGPLLAAFSGLLGSLGAPQPVTQIVERHAERAAALAEEEQRIAARAAADDGPPYPVEPGR